MQNINKEQSEIPSLECKFQGGRNFVCFLHHWVPGAKDSLAPGRHSLNIKI